MHIFSRQGLNLAYYVHGEGRPVLLIHGITVSFQRNFLNPGWVAAITAAGCQVIGIDLRGHGQSDKPYEKSAYGTDALAGDALALLDHLELDRVGLFGYSLGTSVALDMLLRAPGRFTAATLGGTGDGLIAESTLTMNHVASRLTAVLERTSLPGELPQHESIYWTFATTADGDRHACLAAAQASYPSRDPSSLRTVTCPVLVLSGDSDLVLGTGRKLAAAFPKGEYLEVKDVNHFTLNRDVSAHQAVAKFFAANTSGA